MAMLLPLVFLLPVVEMYLLIRVGGELGALPTIGLVIGAAVFGILLLRRQGPAALERVVARLQRGEMPATELAEGALLALAGLLLLVPGFCTDLAALVLLVPAARAWLATRLSARFGPPATARNGRHEIIEGEYERRPESADAAPSDSRLDDFRDRP
jgi:UPF0716 protein FxsA